MENTLLNSKLNKWAGTTDVDYMHPTYGIAYCFKWLVPKLGFYQLNNWNKKKKSVAFVWHETEIEGHTYQATSEAPALALCLAIGKLIDETSS